MTTLTSEKNLPKLGLKEVTMTFDMDEMIAKMGKERAEKVVARLVCAYHFGSGLKAACEGTAKREAVVAKHQEWKTMAEEGKTFNGLDFIPMERTGQPDKHQMQIREKWDAAPQEKREAFLKARGLSLSLATEDAETVEDAYLERKAEMADADLG